jgi:hypothetical protein
MGTSKYPTHKTGYHVWIYGIRYWHRTLEAARRNARRFYTLGAGDNLQIVEVATGEQVDFYDDGEEG